MLVKFTTEGVEISHGKVREANPFESNTPTVEGYVGCIDIKQNSPNNHEVTVNL